MIVKAAQTSTVSSMKCGSSVTVVDVPGCRKRSTTASTKWLPCGYADIPACSTGWFWALCRKA